MPEYTIDLARTWQTSIGVQRQIGNTMSVEADYVYSQGRNEKDIIDNVNLTFDPATGANYRFSDITRRRIPEFGLISMQVRTARSSYHALQTAWTKRLSNRWQASATYTLSGLWDMEALPHSGSGPGDQSPRRISAVTSRSAPPTCVTGPCSTVSGRSAAASS